MKQHRVKIRRYLLTASWAAECYDCSYLEVRQYWIFALCGGLQHYDYAEQQREYERQRQ
jgi:hypothetical protein